MSSSDENVIISKNSGVEGIRPDGNVDDGSSGAAPKKQEVKLVNIPVTDQNSALTLLVSFLNLAQRRGTFSIDESAKIWECIKVFQDGK
jgi:hypothetical protein